MGAGLGADRHMGVCNITKKEQLQKREERELKNPIDRVLGIQ